jgi:hypothetical protein
MLRVRCLAAFDTIWTRHRVVGVAELAAGHGFDAAWTRLGHASRADLDGPGSQSLVADRRSDALVSAPNGGSQI